MNRSILLPSLLATVFVTTAACAQVDDADVQDCKASLESKLAQYREDMRVRDYWTATINIRRCAEVLDDSNLKQLVADAEVRSYVQDVESSPNIHTKLRSLEALLRDYPAVGKQYSWMLPRLVEELKAKSTATLQEVRRSRIPKIGTTMRDVLENFWGEPIRKNRRVTSAGTTEQWVYGEGRYLYFQDGVLTSIDY